MLRSEFDARAWDRKQEQFSGGDVGGAIPDPIPNSEVKPSRADGTAWEAKWESRTPPGIIYKPAKSKDLAGFFLLTS